MGLAGQAKAMTFRNLFMLHRKKNLNTFFTKGHRFGLNESYLCGNNTLPLSTDKCRFLDCNKALTACTSLELLKYLPVLHTYNMANI